MIYKIISDNKDNKAQTGKHIQTQYLRVFVPSQYLMSVRYGNITYWYSELPYIWVTLLGIATALIDAIIKHAASLEYETIGLNVDVANPKAERLYRRLGFDDAGQIMIGDHWYRHLQRSTSQALLTE